LVQVVFDHEMTCWLRVFGLAFELLFPPPSFSASGVCAFQFVTLEHFVRSTGSSSWATLRLRGKFILKRDSLKFFAEVSDPIFALLALQ
jgi:hypothetical protein